MKTSQADLVALRSWMVNSQLKERGIRDPRVLEAFLTVPRHEFVLAEHVSQAYEDCPLPIGLGQTISQPYMVAAMTEALELQGKEKVLEVGTGSGYQSAILARLAGHIFTIERYPELSARAQERLERRGCANVTCVIGDGSQGYPEAAPYDSIVVTAGSPRVPQALTDQLAEGGRLVIPVGDMFSQELLLVQRNEKRITQQTINYCRFVPLTGKGGWDG